MARTPKVVRKTVRKIKLSWLYESFRRLLVLGSGYDLPRLKRMYMESVSTRPSGRKRSERAMRGALSLLRKEGFV